MLKERVAQPRPAQARLAGERPPSPDRRRTAPALDTSSAPSRWGPAAGGVAAVVAGLGALAWMRRRPEGRGSRDDGGAGLRGRHRRQRRPTPPSTDRNARNRPRCGRAARPALRRSDAAGRHRPNGSTRPSRPPTRSLRRDGGRTGLRPRTGRDHDVLRPDPGALRKPSPTTSGTTPGKLVKPGQAARRLSRRRHARRVRGSDAAAQQDVQRQDGELERLQGRPHGPADSVEQMPHIIQRLQELWGNGRRRRTSTRSCATTATARQGFP